MGKVGRFIDHCCEHHPHLMRAVLDRPLSPLGNWLMWNESNHLCGCLIGTSAIAAGFHARGTPATTRVPYNDGDTIRYVADLIEWTDDEIAAVGMAVFYVSERISGETNKWGRMNTRASDARTVHLIRQRIARQLAVRESALGVNHPALPNEPIEGPALRAGAGAG
jgi:hypothetical protein